MTNIAANKIAEPTPSKRTGLRSVPRHSLVISLHKFATTPTEHIRTVHGIDGRGGQAYLLRFPTASSRRATLHSCFGTEFESTLRGVCVVYSFHTDLVLEKRIDVRLERCLSNPLNLSELEKSLTPKQVCSSAAQTVLSYTNLP